MLIATIATSLSATRPGATSRALRIGFVAMLGLVPAGVLGAQDGGMHRMHDSTAGGDSAYRALQARGATAMGVDQYTSTHRFTDLPDGGRIELERNTDDSAGVAMIRSHMQMIARSFRSGDFSTPMFVHMRHVPGTATMAAKRDVITYVAIALPRGGAVRITTHDPDAVAAVHEFLAFQRQDHRAGGDP
jgi:hypothetical protein